MHFKFRNVNSASTGLVQGIFDGTIPTNVVNSRAGEVAVVEEPVIVTYQSPLERVLFNRARDANPFLHLFESLWMLAGRRDIAPVAYYAANYAAQVQDGNDLNANGAYGYRWRQAPTNHPPTEKWEHGVMYPDSVGISGNQYWVDQIKILIDHLKRNPESRRAVLQMWNVEDDLLKIDVTKDTCCNTCVYFATEQGVCRFCGGTGKVPGREADYGEPDSICGVCKGLPHDQPQFLNMTVCNRSNDLIWGMLGANVVHFSFLLEYMAIALELEVGTYNQFTNNMHVYTKRWEPEKWLADKDPDWYSLVGEDQSPCGPVNKGPFIPFVHDVATFDQEVVEFIDSKSWTRNWNEPFLQKVATPMCRAFSLHKQRDYHGALKEIENVEAADWKIAGRDWIEKRRVLFERKTPTASSPNKE
jgi:thymidylate synthase